MTNKGFIRFSPERSSQRGLLRTPEQRGPSWEVVSYLIGLAAGLCTHPDTPSSCRRKRSGRKGLEMSIKNMHGFPFPANSHLYLYRISRVLCAAEVRRGAVALRCVVHSEMVTSGAMSPVVQQ